jgi:hypothetical protein
MPAFSVRVLLTIASKRFGIVSAVIGIGSCLRCTLLPSSGYVIGLRVRVFSYGLPETTPILSMYSLFLSGRNGGFGAAQPEPCN